MPSARPDERPQLNRLLNIAEIAEYLGVDVRHIRRLVHERRIPFIKWGHLLRFDPDEIATWIDQHRRGLEVLCATHGRSAPLVRSAPRRRPAQAEPLVRE